MDFIQRKQSGGINLVFNNKFMDYIIKYWDIGLDHKINYKMIEDKYPLCCLDNGVINHIGRIGLWSRYNRYDNDETF